MKGLGIHVALTLVSASTMAAEVEFSMAADRSKVGTEDTFRLEIVVGQAPEGSLVQFPAPRDFEVLSRSQSTQMSYSVGPGGAGVVKQVLKHTLVMRALRAGTLTIPPAGLQTPRKLYQTEAVTLEVVPGRLGRDPRSAQRQHPFPFPGFPGLLGPDDDLFPDPPSARPPRGDSELFLRSTVDKNEVVVGEQVMLTIVIYSRLDLSSVDAVTMPKLEGFWTQDLKAPTQLSAEEQVVEGVRYRTYVIRQKALFPMRAGDITIEPAEADITTGFIFQGHRVHRKGNAVTLKVRPLPAGVTTTTVGQWRLSADVNQTEVALGDPIQLKFIVEGRGNLQSVQLPPLEAPPSMRAFDPQVTEKVAITRHQVGGTRVVEYVLVPQQTGTFTVPGLSLSYFDPESKRQEETRTDPVTITVRPSSTGQQHLSPSGPGVALGEATKNQLVGGGLKPLRHSAHFSTPRPPVWSHPLFLVLVAAPLVVGGLWGGVALGRKVAGRAGPEARQKQQARAARRRLSAAEKLLGRGSPAGFYTEVERALTSFLSAKLGQPVQGLTRAALDDSLKERDVPEPVRARVQAVLETCDQGRYAPGLGELAARRRALDDAAGSMEGWPS